MAGLSACALSVCSLGGPAAWSLAAFAMPGCGSPRQEAAPARAAAQSQSAPAPALAAPAAGPVTSGAPATAPPPTVPPAPEVSLYFADSAGRLKSERRALALEGSPSRRARMLVEALLSGPTGGLTPTLPKGAGLRECYVMKDGTAYVDFDATFASRLSKGSEDALVAVWSLTNTLAAAVPEVHQVKILVEGEEVSDLGGHLDLTQPVLPEMDLIQEVGRPSSAREAPPG